MVKLRARRLKELRRGAGGVLGTLIYTDLLAGKSTGSDSIIPLSIAREQYSLHVMRFLIANRYSFWSRTDLGMLAGASNGNQDVS